MNKKHIALVVVVLLIIGAIYYLQSTKAGPRDVIDLGDSDGLDLNIDDGRLAKELLKDGQYPLAPEMTGIVGYLNSEEGIKISDFEGSVVLIDFWTYTCINCIRTLPYLTEWDEKYKDKGLVIIGVHTPEFEFEKKKENVQAAIDKYGIEYRVVQDNDYGTWRAYENRYWPRKYLIDSEGYIRYDHIGEGGYEETELKIQKLLGEIGEDVSDMELTEEEEGGTRRPTTPELYAGSLTALSRGQYIGNAGDAEEGLFILPDEIDENVIYLDGLWEWSIDNLRLVGDEGIVALEFTAREVNIVANSEIDEELIMEVLIDGNYVSEEQAGYDVEFDEEISFVRIDQARLYNIIDGEHGDYRLDLKVKKDFSFNAFTFG
jgi:thiol-disulfide isomerase/thioredoxin